MWFISALPHLHRCNILFRNPPLTCSQRSICNSKTWKWYEMAPFFFRYIDICFLQMDWITYQRNTFEMLLIIQHRKLQICYILGMKRQQHLCTKNIIFFFSLFFFNTQNVYISRVRASPEMAEKHIHTHTQRQWCRFSVKLLCLSTSFCLGWSSFPGLYIFSGHPRNPTYMLHGDMLPLVYLTDATHVALLLRNTYVLFTLGSKQTSCYVTHATHEAFSTGALSCLP